MLSDDIKRRFVSQALEDEAKAIAAEQAEVVQDWNLFGPERRLYKDLINQSQGHFTLRAEGQGEAITVRYLKYLRFLDIPSVRRKRESFHLYNRILFGHLYNPLLHKLRFGYTEQMQKAIKKELMKVMGSTQILMQEL